MKKTILWEPWKDPFEALVNARKGRQDDLQPNTFDADDYDGPVLWSRMGPIPLNEEMLPSRVYNFRVGHTNFPLTSAVANIIQNEPGVEGLDVISRYRFRVCTGKAFQQAAVLKGIEASVQSESGGEAEAAVARIAAFLRTRCKHWALLVFGDGSTRLVRAGSAAEVRDRVARSPLTKISSYVLFSDDPE